MWKDKILLKSTEIIELSTEPSLLKAPEVVLIFGSIGA
jgi:hypothetical protein